MSERDKLLASVATTIKSYRRGELPEPTPDHVDRWLRQFTPSHQLEFLREFDHVLGSTFLTQAFVVDFLKKLATNPKLAGADPSSYWAKANFLSVQKAGHSQRDMVALFGEVLAKTCQVDISESGTPGGDYIYLDDVLFTGGRVASDLETWIAQKAPPKATVQVILIALHTSGHYYISTSRLKKAIESSKKSITIHFWRQIELENQKQHRNDSDVLWPSEIPDLPDVQAYIAQEKKFPLQLRTPGGDLGLFSSEAGRRVLEREFLAAGVKIRSLSKTPKDFIRPLGNGAFGAGFGSLIATYRNCPNNCPLAMWWGNPEHTSGALHWYPLLSRKTYD